MPPSPITWSVVLDRLQKSAVANNNIPQFDAIRREYLAQLHDLTKRHTILYATKFTRRDPNIPQDLLSIVDEDMQGLMEVVHGSKERKLDLILHSPGGSVDAAEAMVLYLRSKFTDIRIIVPHLAQSAATMMCCAADTVLMGKHSFLGPTDPQVYVSTPLGNIFVPAQAIIDQFDMASAQCQDPKKLSAWMPMLSQYGPHLLKTCEHLIALSRDLVEDWLKRYMFKKKSMLDRIVLSQKLSKWLTSHHEFKTHSRHISRSQLQRRKMNVKNLEDDQTLQNLVLAVYHSATHTFDGSTVVKIIENHLGKAYIKQVNTVMAAFPAGPIGQMPGQFLLPPQPIKP